MVLFNSNDSFRRLTQGIFPLTNSPLVQCITNEITCESMANALLYIDAKPIMADDAREFAELFDQTNSLLLNLGHLSMEREQNLLAAARFAEQTQTPVVIDLVGVAATELRYELAHQLAACRPTVIKGNSSEMRAYCGLQSNARGVDASAEDQEEEQLLLLAKAMQAEANQHPGTVYLATGEKDLVVSSTHASFLANGVAELDRFTGTGDIVGALIAALLGVGNDAFVATITAVSYFNLCGEAARKRTTGLANFRQETLNQLSLLMNQVEWAADIRGGSLWQTTAYI